MNDLGVIDQFLSVFSTYIDSGFGLLHGEVAFLTATLVVLDMVLAGLFWTMGGEDVLGRFIKKVLYIGAFSLIISNFNMLASIVFRSFAGLGLLATNGAMTSSDLLHPGRLAKIGVDAAYPILKQIGDLAGFPGVFLNLDSVVVMFLAFLIVLLSFFILAIQLFVTLIEFKLTTLAGFILVPFALWNRTAFLAERVLGNVVSAGVKVMVLAVIVGIGSTIFSQFHAAIGSEPSIDQALAVMLAALTMLGLGIFGPGIATGLVSGAPQLGAGAAVGTALTAGGLAVAGGAAVVGAGRFAARGAATMAASTTLVDSARQGLAGARVGAPATPGAPGHAASGTSAGGASASPTTAAHSTDRPPTWAQRLISRTPWTRGMHASAQTLRSADHGGSGASPRLDDKES